MTTTTHSHKAWTNKGGHVRSTQIRPSEQPHFWEKRIVACVPSNGCLAVHATKSPRI